MTVTDEPITLHAVILSGLSNYVAPAALKLLLALVVWFVGGYAIKAIISLNERALNLRRTDATVVRYTRNFLSVALKIGLVVGLLGFLGLETSSFAALIAAAGVAIGVAWAGLLSNFAAGVFLVVLRPFKVGDAVMTAGVTGEVKEIGLFGTKIDTADGVRVVVGNSKVFAENISNFSHNPVRRADATCQLAHGVDVEAAITLFRAEIESIEQVLAEPKPIVEILESNALGTLLVLRVFVPTMVHGQTLFELQRRILRLRSSQNWPVPETRTAVRQIESASQTSKPGSQASKPEQPEQPGMPIRQSSEADIS